MRPHAWRLALLVLCALMTGAFLAREPWIAYQKHKEQARMAEEEMRRNEAQRAELMRKKAEVASPAGREKQARESGYIKKGEVPLQLPGSR